MLLHRGLAWHYDLPAPVTILVDLVIIAAATVNAAPSLRSGPVIALTALGCIPLAMLVSGAIYFVAIIMGLVMGGAVLYEWALARGGRPGGRSGPPVHDP